MKKLWETGIILFASMGFWGMIYPDLCFTQDVCINVTETDKESEEYEGDIFTQICEASPEQIRLKSKLLDFLFEKEVVIEDSMKESNDLLADKTEKKFIKVESKGKNNDIYKKYQCAQ